ncbi:MAG: carboxypeptidase-like regulatory domain-containing protein [Candidatus Pacebacteria bacterium]|nr:carboxypeptidase-like regulatory domain-containing protein [Candidatus Paceibacterota bacterium]
MRFLGKVILGSFFAYLLGIGIVFAGNIDTTYKTAKPLLNGYGYINLATSEGNVTVTDSAVTGYAWGSTLGWINLSPSNSGVINDGSGNLSGYAWGEATGWINFAPSNGGVTINTGTGIFSGYAWSENIGWISFNCDDESVCATDDYKVKTSWVPSSEGTVSGSTSVSTPPPVPTEDPEPEPIPPVPEVEEEPSEEPVTEEPVLDEDGPDESVLDEGVDNVVDTVVETFRDVITSAGSVVTNVSKKTSDFIANDPVGVVSSRVVSTTGVVGGALVSSTALLANPVSAGELVTLPIRIWTVLLSFLGLRKKYRPWGTVYDSVTKQPLDPAYVVLKDLNGKEVSTAITDIDGRYGFLVNPGSYILEANKTNYTYPSRQLAGKGQDELYSNLYFGSEVNLDEEDAVIAKNIPMDPIKFDWNEFAKKDKKLMRFYSRFDVWFSKFIEIAFIVGFLMSLVALFASPAPYNLIVFGVYIFLLVLRILGLKPKRSGHIVERDTRNPLSFSIIKVYAEGVTEPIVKRISDAYGRYFCLVPKGDYYVTIEKKNPDGSYMHVFTSEKIKAKNGIIHEDFKVV